MSSYEDCINELVQDFIGSFGSEWSAEDCDLAERVIAEATERFEDDWRELTGADEGHFDKQELNDFWDEVGEQARFALRAYNLI